jgi:hypothetical protein
MLFSNISLPFSDKTILPNISQGRLAAPLSIWRLCALYTLHAGAARPWDRYSVLHLFQKWCLNLSKSWCRDSRLILSSVRSGSDGAVRASPMKKCLGVMAVRSSGSLDMGTRGREFRHASMRVRRVYNSS